jgi:anti-anti-sigma factor
VDHASDGVSPGSERGRRPDVHERAPLRLAPAGEFDIAGTADLERELDQAFGAGYAVELDLSGITFMDSIGLGVLLRRLRDAASNGDELVVTRAQLHDQVARLIDLTGTGEVIWPSEGEQRRGRGTV